MNYDYPDIKNPNADINCETYF